MSSVLVVPIGGLGSRFKDSKYPEIKPCIPIHNIPMAIASVRCFYGIADEIIFSIRKFDGYESLVRELEKENCEFKIHLFDELTKGPAVTIYNSLDYFKVPLNYELYTINCDQILRWDPIIFKHFCSQDCGGSIITFEGGDSRHSFVALNKNGGPIIFKEKIKISDIALTGIHYWKTTKLYKDCVDKMLEEKCNAPNGEYYVSLAYNYLLEMNKKVLVYHIPKQIFHPVGTPEELDSYIKIYETL